MCKMVKMMRKIVFPLWPEAEAGTSAAPGSGLQELLQQRRTDRHGRFSWNADCGSGIEKESTRIDAGTSGNNKIHWESRPRLRFL